MVSIGRSMVASTPDVTTGATTEVDESSDDAALSQHDIGRQMCYT